MEAARNRALPPVPPGWIESIDPYTDQVVYTNALTGARVRFPPKSKTAASVREAGGGCR